MVVDGLEVFAGDLVPLDAVFSIEHHSQIADDVFDELGIVVGFLGDPFFIGAFEYGEDG